MREFNLLKICVIAFILFLMSQVTIAQDGYKGIVPMNSTCHDVKNILGSGECGIAEETFKFPEEILKIVYTTKECEEFYGKKWDVPVGTVVSITRFFRNPPSLKDLGIKINESEYSKSYTDVLNQIIYEKKDGGLFLIISGRYVSDIKYTPTSEDNLKTCECNESSKPK